MRREEVGRLTRLLLKRPAADRPRHGEAVVEVHAGVALAGAATSVEVGLRRPRTFREIHPVVFQQRTFAVVNLGNRLVVIDQRAVIVALGLG